ncbi:hypothetical protein [Roseobacter sinensis]|uniref:Uncharacterized protein n=1 Tax=Roseobacter sinensis TaxID=2931391 RepID=A0ABT3BJC3_9RHOB|nr:hypothetical protein [Roseobacter sp. WL0113]MCV3273224.1 hypothetical protein [Roseobacter sp. WL0113]
MLKLLQNTSLWIGGLLAVTAAGSPQSAYSQSYQIDCAILLCLSGGWPTSGPCARARAEFIRRITPWPVEPPLQIWRCPMGAANTVDPEAVTDERIYETLFELDQTTPLQSFPVDEVGKSVTGVARTPASALPPTLQAPPHAAPSTLQPDVLRLRGDDAAPLPKGFTFLLAQGRADIDISGPEFNFVRSIRVFQTEARQWESGREGECNSHASVRLGIYGTQGDFRWRQSGVGALPEAHVGLEQYGDHCPRISHRSVFVEWRDYEGNYGYEQVNY